MTYYAFFTAMAVIIRQWLAGIKEIVYFYRYKGKKWQNLMN